MMTENSRHNRTRVANSRQLTERSFLLVDCVYQGTATPIILVRSAGKCYGYLNRCVHMPFRLDCESKEVFRISENRIKCSMHGIIYHPETGESLSPTMCTGEKLTSVKTEEDAQGIWFLNEGDEALS